MQNFRNRSVNVAQFTMVPRADIPRSNFKIETSHKTTFDAGYLIPVFLDEVLPGDTFNVNMTAFARMATPIFPLMDNLHMETFFFFVPNRLVFKNWVKLMGEQDNPGDSIDYTVPQIYNPTPYAPLSIYDYFGLPTTGQGTGGFAVSSLPLRCYNLIWNQWFRDENLQDAVPQLDGDGPDSAPDFKLLKRGKRKDYFTSALPFVQKGSPVSFGLTGEVPVLTNGLQPQFVVPSFDSANRPLQTSNNDGNSLELGGTNTGLTSRPMFFGNQSGLKVDLADATATTVNALRNSFQVQKLLERDARGGTRYTELTRAHFGVTSPDARLQRAEYLGGGYTSINITPVAQTSATSSTPDSTPLGELAAVGTGVSTRNGFTQSFTEHGHIIGLVSIRADLTYQQGIRKLWDRRTRYDFYFPVFSQLGEQPVLNREIYYSGNDPVDKAVFGYQERWAEYRYHPTRISGLFKSTTAGTIDGWHLAQRFTNTPTLNNTFIEENVPMERVLAVGAQANGQQFIFDSHIRISATRPLPMFGVPGLIDHF